GDDDEGIEPGLEVHDDQQVDEHDGEGEPGQEPDVGRPHGPQLPAHREEAAARELGPVGVRDPGDVTADGAEIAVLHGAVDVDDAADVVVGEHGHLAAAVDGGHVGQDAGPRRGGRADRNVLQVVTRLDPVLRRLGRQVVGDPVL